MEGGYEVLLQSIDQSICFYVCCHCTCCGCPVLTCGTCGNQGGETGADATSRCEESEKANGKPPNVWYQTDTLATVWSAVIEIMITCEYKYSHSLSHPLLHSFTRLTNCLKTAIIKYMKGNAYGIMNSQVIRLYFEIIW